MTGLPDLVGSTFVRANHPMSAPQLTTKGKPPAATGGKRKEEPLTTTILTDEVNMLPILSVLGDDSSRARRTDPVTSHQAADKSADGLSEMKRNILNIFERFGELTDSELNDVYVLQAEMFGWKKVRPDTPRKRRSDLTSDGYLVDTGVTRANKYGSAEVVWGLKK